MLGEARKVIRESRVDISRVSTEGYFRTTSTISVNGLRTVFQIEKRHGAKRANTGKLQVYNFNPDTRAELQHKPLQVRIAAGHRGDVRDIFVGDVRWVKTVRQDGDVITELELGDGERAYSEAKLRRSYRSGVSGRAVVSDLIGAMGMKVPKSVDDATELLQQFAGGYVADGQASKHLTEVLGKHGYAWSIQNGQMQVTRQGGILPGEALLIDAAHGMVGSPDFGAPTRASKTGKGGKPPTITVKTLLEPIAVPGMRIRVEAEEVSGLFKVVKVQHTGDTEGQDAPWHTDYEAVPL